MRKIEKIGFYLAMLIAIIITIFFIAYSLYLLNFSNLGSFSQSWPLIIATFKNNIINFTFNKGQMSINFIISIIIFLVSFSVIYRLIYTLINFKTLKQKKIIQTAFLHYVSPSIVQDILTRPESLVLGGKSAYLTVYFIDIEKSSELLNDYHPKKVVEYLNEYFSVMAEVILQNEGTIDKYIGDSIMAFWGAPKPQDEHAYNACKTALEHQEKMIKLKTKWRNEKKPELQVKIGIASGNMIVGNIGSKGHFNYTVIGKPVNHCFEIEKLTRKYQVDILVAEETYHLTKHDFEFREIGDINLKGNKNTLRIFQLYGFKGKLKEQDYQFITSYHEALEFFRSKQLAEARKAINECLRFNPNDKASQLLKNEIEGVLNQKIIK